MNNSARRERTKNNIETILYGFGRSNQKVDGVRNLVMILLRVN